jgi:hypothetical protein
MDGYVSLTTGQQRLKNMVYAKFLQMRRTQMIRKNFNITEENQKQLKELHEQTGASESEIMRRAIVVYYKNTTYMNQVQTQISGKPFNAFIETTKE